MGARPVLLGHLGTMIHIVFTGRNGFYVGSRLSDRLMEVMDWNVRMFRRHDLEHTFWFVEWGTDHEGDWLSPVLVERYPTCRCIMVPNAIVGSAQRHPVGFSDLAGRNVAISRAEGGLVISTDNDILFSDELTEYLKRLVPDDMCIYRAPRQDFKYAGLLPDDETDLELGRLHDLGVDCREGAAAFTAATPKGWEALGGYCESKEHVWYLDSEVVVKAGHLGMLSIVVPHVYHREHADSSQFEDKWWHEWGEYDRDLAVGRKVLPRNELWGQRHCVLREVQGERLVYLEAPARDKPHMPDAAAEPGGAGVTSMHSYARKKEKLESKWMSTRPGENDLAYSFFFRESLGRLLNCGNTVSVAEFRWGVRALQELIKAPDLTRHIEDNRGTFPRTLLPMLVIKLRSEIIPGEEKLIEKLERAYGLLMAGAAHTGAGVGERRRDSERDERELAETRDVRESIARMLNRTEVVSLVEYNAAVDALKSLIDAEDLQDYVRDNRDQLPGLRMPTD